MKKMQTSLHHEMMTIFQKNALETDKTNRSIWAVFDFYTKRLTYRNENNIIEIEIHNNESGYK